MKFKIYGKYKIIPACIINIFIIFIYSHALAHEKSKIIQIYSTYQSINVLTNTITFTGHVTLKYDNINIHADKILVFHNTKDTNLPPIIQAYGNPATFNQKQETNGGINTVYAQSLLIDYNTENNTINLLGKAYIEQSGNSVRSDNITYSIKKKQINATSTQGNQVITTLIIKSI